MYERGRRDGWNARAAGKGAQSSDSEYLRGFSDGWAAWQAAADSHAARQAAAEGALSWTDRMHTSIAHHDGATFQVVFEGFRWRLERQCGYTYRTLRHGHTRETCKRLAVAWLASRMET
jgi:hypothetical protein